MNEYVADDYRKDAWLIALQSAKWLKEQLFNMTVDELRWAAYSTTKEQETLKEDGTYSAKITLRVARLDKPRAQEEAELIYNNIHKEERE